MSEKVQLIDPSVKDEVLRFPTAELVRLLFPGESFHGRSCICNPLRGEKHPSLSFYRGYDGYSHWKDHATGETGDNIDFYRLVFPAYGYVEAVDRLALQVLGRSALQEYVPGRSVPFYSVSRQYRVPHQAQPVETPKISIVSSRPYRVGAVPDYLVNYVRERGISDMVAGSYFEYVQYENANRKGRTVIDPSSGRPVMENGQPLKSDGLFEAVALRNDIGGYSLRVPPTETAEGFKGVNVSSITTILADGRRPLKTVSFVGQEGDGFIRFFSYDPVYRRLWVNPSQFFEGVQPWTVVPAMAFLDAWTGRYLEGRELEKSIAVLNSLNCPVAGEVDVVEGMFDAVSVFELDRITCRGGLPPRDLIVLNSISNIQWAIPFLAVHGKVRCLLDNDMKTNAGQKASQVLADRVAAFAGRIGSMCMVRSDSGYFYPCNDVNDYLKLLKRNTSVGQKSVPLSPQQPRENGFSGNRTSYGKNDNGIK